jgi:DNA polymerase
VGRAALCATPGYKLVGADFAAVESRALAWAAGETWKLDAFREYDRSGDERLHPYRQIAAKMLRKDVLAVTKGERQLGKYAELAFGYAGVVGAWRRIISDDGRTDAQITAINCQWRSVHPQTQIFWKRLMRAACIAIHTRQAIRVNPAPAPSIIADFDGHALTLELPSGRLITYPGARLVANQAFENGDPDIAYFDNAKGKWSLKRAWTGVIVENVTSGISRDLLAAALLRADNQNHEIVHHVHDELVIEARADDSIEARLLACMLVPPPWAAGLPIGGKVSSGPTYFNA